jgi:hypothetical protein
MELFGFHGPRSLRVKEDQVSIEARLDSAFFWPKTEGPGRALGKMPSEIRKAQSASAYPKGKKERKQGLHSRETGREFIWFVSIRILLGAGEGAMVGGHCLQLAPGQGLPEGFLIASRS